MTTLAMTAITRTGTTTTDPETSLPPASDPFLLSRALKSDAEIEEITASRRARARGRLLSRTSSADKLQDRVKGKVVDYKGLRGFYESQNASIQRMLKSVDDHVQEAKDERIDSNLKFKIAVHGSLIANLLLAVLQMYGAISSLSLSLFGTMIDAVFDPMSNIILIVTHRAVNRVDASRWPSGKARLETAGNIAFAFLMMSVSLILIVLSARDIASHNGNDKTEFHLPSTIAVAIALTVKFTLFLYCYSLRNTYSQIRILWLDHRNDLPINAFGLFTSVAGSKIVWWLDPGGAIIIGCAIVAVWSKVIYEESLLLIGVAADPGVRELITYVSMTHSDKITHIDTVRAYHSGPRIIAEVDIVMPAETTLRETHDVAEELQMKLESLPDVERAYVHVDWESEHKPEHFLKKEL